MEEAPEQLVFAERYIEFDRKSWAQLRPGEPSPIGREELERLRSLDDPVNVDEVSEVYVPLAHLIELEVSERLELRRRVSSYLEERLPVTPFIVAIAGSVAAGKSTTARVLERLLGQLYPGSVALVTTDGFLYPNAVLDERALMNKKGFPESYDVRALLRFLGELKSGVEHLEVPVYDHLVYDIVPGKTKSIDAPTVVILEGLNVLQVPHPRSHGPLGFAVSDFLDLSIYVDAATEDLEHWFVSRFLTLRETAFKDPHSYFKMMASLSLEEAIEMGRRIWREINEVNLIENILPTRSRADVVLHKSSDHRVEQVRLRKF